jgi:hypothetical protein
MVGKKLISTIKDIEVEWYSGKDFHARPRRIKVNDVWEDVFHFEKQVHEDFSTRKRRTVFRCHIGDNRIIEFALLDYP